MTERLDKLSEEVHRLGEKINGLQSGVQPRQVDHPFLVRHMGVIALLAGWLVTAGIFLNRFQSLEAMYQRSELHGSEFARESIQEIKSEIKVLDARVLILENEKDKSGAAIQTLLSDMRLVRGWIDEQREKEKISKTALVPPKL